MRERSDEKLMKAYAGGDMAAFELLYQRHREPLYTWFHRRHCTLQEQVLPCLQDRNLRDSSVTHSCTATQLEPRHSVARLEVVVIEWA